MSRPDGIAEHRGNGATAAPAENDRSLPPSPTPPRQPWHAADRAPGRNGVGARPRPEVRGKFLHLGGEKLYIKGVTYGTFRPDEHGDGFPPPDVVERDFAQMASSGVNAVRTYTPPPRWLLDSAQRYGLLVLAGFAWEQHVAFLDGRGQAADIERRMRAAIRSCASHAALLGWTIGNEIPASIVRWHGRERIQRFLRRLYVGAKTEDPGALVTYVNYPSTEYLELPFVDFACFNVYLEDRARLEAYLARLHNIAGERPLVMAEIGLDSRRNGEAVQAETLSWQVEAAFGAGVAGAFVFAWTDEWYITHLDDSGQGQGGTAIEDWDFGLTDRERRPKRALAAVRDAFASVPLAAGVDWPRVSVVICSLNGERTLGETLEAVYALEYPDFEVIVVDDGSTDSTAALAAAFGARVISTENRGLSNARNTGMMAATGEIVAFTDDDARPDPHWLLYLVATFRSGGHAAVGGPNLPPPGALVADCVAAAPGGPQHVLVSDREAEHIPGCNCAFRKSALEAIDGFDGRFRVAGDDVDLCWRLQDAGESIGFAPAAVVWHEPRQSVRAYLRQQRGYGVAEGMLERKWPARYSAGGHLSWRGRLYGRGALPALRRRTRVYHGTWNSGLFQSLYDGPPGTVNQFAQTPEWALVIAVLAVLSLLGVYWPPLTLVIPLVVAAFALMAAQAALGGLRAPLRPSYGGLAAWKARALTALLFLLQPLARLRGRLSQGLTPWRRRASCAAALPLAHRRAIWSRRWRRPDAWLEDVERALRAAGAVSVRGGDFDAWDLEIRGGLLGRARLLSAIEEHGAGLQMVRFRIVPRVSPLAALFMALFAILAFGAVLDSAWVAAVVLAVCAVVLAAWVARECGQACGAALSSLAGGPARAAFASRPLDHAEPASVEA